MEDPVRGVFINDLAELAIDNAQQAKAAILDSLARRSHNATTSNEYSSRSHAILQFTIRQFRPQGEGEVAVSESKLFLIDLAGNEKAGQNESKRFVEGININKSLLTLGKCINILADQKRPVFIPFRDSKLTRILKDSLGGNSKTVMIACVSPEARFYEQTLNTLKYSSKARRIKNKGKAASIKLIHPRQVPLDVVHCETEP
jgi:kinesin family protein 18/19